MDPIIEVAFAKERETKNTVRYSEDGPAHHHKIGVVYIHKVALEDAFNEFPDNLTITIKKC